MSKRSHEFYQALRPTIYFSRPFGIVPMSLEKNKIVKPCLLITAAVAGYFFYGVCRVLDSMYNNPILPTFEKMMLMLQVATSSSTSIVTWLKNHLLFRSLTPIFQQLDNVEELLVSVGMEVNIRRRKKVQYHFIAWIVFFTFNNIGDNVILGENILSLFTMYSIAMHTITHFLLTTLLIKEYFAFINDKLKSIGQLSPEGLPDIVKLVDEVMQDRWASRRIPFQDRPAFLNVLRVVTECHSELFKISNDLNKYFGLQILLDVTHNILNVTSICYYVPAIFIDESDKPHHYMIISIKSVTFMAVFGFVQLWVTAYICSVTSDEANSTALVVHGILNQPKYSCFSDELEKFSDQLLHQKLQFTAHGFFVIDFTLLNTVIGVVITYIVILIQFQMSSSNKQQQLATPV